MPGAGSHSSLIPCVLCTLADVPEATPSFVTLSERWLWGWCWCWWGYKKKAGSLQEAARGTSGASVWGTNTEVDWFIHSSKVWQNLNSRVQMSKQGCTAGRYSRRGQQWNEVECKFPTRRQKTLCLFPPQLCERNKSPCAITDWYFMLKAWTYFFPIMRLLSGRTEQFE